MASRTARRCLALIAALVLMPWGAPGAKAADLERLTLEPAGGTTFRVQAVYPNTGETCEAKRKKDYNARFRGTLEVVRQADGSLALIDHLTFDEYLQGLAEMPRSWPIEALRAQVVAARTYAMYQLAHPRSAAATLGYDICSTDQCQVFSGLSVEQGAFGDAWVRAVRSTRGRVVQYHAEPVNAFYFSTSSGRTKRNFPDSSPLPYIKSVAGQDDASPLAHWTVKVPLADLGPILEAGKDWPGGAIGSVRLSGETVTVSGGGRTSSISKRSFRFDLNDQAACVFPGRYPTAGSSGSSLPQTVPSIDFSLSQSGSSIMLTGRGWGHGVGMSQYGAKSLAERGRSYGDIVAYYYAGIHPTTVKDPGAIRVLVVEDASLVRLQVEGSATATLSNGGTLAPGDRFEVRGGGALDIRRGIGPDLVPVLNATLDSTAPVTVPSGGTLELSYVLSGPARVTVVVSREGTEVLRTAEVSQIKGANRFVVSLDQTRPSPTPTSVGSASPGATPSPTPAYAVVPQPLEEGDYQMALEVFDGLDRIKSLPVALTVEAREIRAVPPVRPGPPLWLLIVAVAAFGGTVAIVVRSRRAARTG